MKAEEIVVKAFKVWKENFKIGVLFSFGFSLPVAVLFIGVYWLLRLFSLPKSTEILKYKALLTSLLSTPIKIFAAVYAVWVVLLLVLEFFSLSGICGCGKALKNEKISFFNLISCALRRYPIYVLATIIMAVLLNIPKVIYILVSTLGLEPPKLIFSIASAVIGLAFVYVPYAVVEGYGVFESLKVSFKCVREEIPKTIVSIIFSFLVTLATFTIVIPLIFVVAVLTVLNYKNLIVLSIIYGIFSILLSLGLGYGEYLVSTIMYLTFLDISGKST